MFQSLEPLLAERSIHILLSATRDGLLTVYVSPAKKGDREDAAFTTPFQCTASAVELDAQLPDVLTKWIASRQVVMTDLAAALAAAEDAAKKAAEDAKKAAAQGKRHVPATRAKPATPEKTVLNPATPVTPSLLDSCGTYTGTPDVEGEAGVGGEGGEITASNVEAGVASTAKVAPALVEPTTAATASAMPSSDSPAPLEAPAAPATTVSVVTAVSVSDELF